MDALLLPILQNSLSDYAELRDIDASQLPMTLRNVQLKPDAINQEYLEGGAAGVELAGGTIGSVTITPGWMGTFEVRADDVRMNFNLNPMAALSRSSAQEPVQAPPQTRGLPPAALATRPSFPMQSAPGPAGRPRFCSHHNTPASRPKGQAQARPCRACGQLHSSNFLQFSHCPMCSERDCRCMVCGSPDVPGGNVHSQPARGSRGLEPDRRTADRESGSDSFEALRQLFQSFNACSSDAAVHDDFEIVGARSPIAAT